MPGLEGLREGVASSSCRRRALRRSSCRLRKRALDICVCKGEGRAGWLTPASRSRLAPGVGLAGRAGAGLQGWDGEQQQHAHGQVDIGACRRRGGMSGPETSPWRALSLVAWG